MSQKKLSKPEKIFEDVRQHGLPFFRYLFQRFLQNRISVTAGYLSYVSLLSLVPILAVVFGMFSAFSVFAELRLAIENQIYNSFMPTEGDVLKGYMDGFVANASNTTLVGIAALVFVAIKLISAIDTNLNHIWHSTKPRPLSQALSMYWMVLTLGPVLMGASIALSSYIVSLKLLDEGSLFGIGMIFLRLIPILLSVIMFFLIFTIVPTAKVRVRHALVGATVAAVLFDIAKQAFAFYITHFPSNQAVYGALATIPILFIWVNLSWTVVLLGAQVTACLGEFNALRLGAEAENAALDEEAALLDQAVSLPAPEVSADPALESTKPKVG